MEAERWAELVKTMLCFIAEELADASGAAPPTTVTPQFTFGRASNGLLQFSQQPGRILRNVSFFFFFFSAPPPYRFFQIQVSAGACCFFFCFFFSFLRLKCHSCPCFLCTNLTVNVSKKGAEVVSCDILDSFMSCWRC